MRTLALTAASALLFCGCQQKILTVQTEYLSHENLASFHVGTPDPRLRNPPLGQKLIVSWSIPHWDDYTSYDLFVKIRFKDGSTTSKDISLCEPQGTFVYPLLNEDYFAKGGFKTYVATIAADGVILEEWRHQLWANLIEIREDNDDLDLDWDEESSPQTDQEIYDEHYKGEGAIQRPIEDITDPEQTQYKYYF